jgi:hypothetical protein
MTEQAMVSAEVDTKRHKIVPKSVLGAETSSASLPRVFISWNLSGTTGKERFIEERPKTLTERLNEAYHDDELEPEEREFLELSREHFSRLDDE